MCHTKNYMKQYSVYCIVGNYFRGTFNIRRDVQYYYISIIIIHQFSCSFKRLFIYLFYKHLTTAFYAIIMWDVIYTWITITVRYVEWYAGMAICLFELSNIKQNWSCLNSNKIRLNVPQISWLDMAVKTR